MDEPKTTSKKPLPPYIPARTFLNFIDRLQVVGPLPSHIDKDVMRSVSGAMQSWLKSSLRFMKLIDDKNVPTAALGRLVKSTGEERKKELRLLFTSTFAFLNGKVDISNTTPQQLRAAIQDLGAQGDTIEKIISFIVGLGKAADIPMSTYLSERKRAPRRPRQKSTRKENGGDAGDARDDEDDAADDEQQDPPGDNMKAMKTVTLPKANGSLTLSGSFNPFDLSGDERKLVYAIADLMDEFAAKAQ